MKKQRILKSGIASLLVVVLVFGLFQIMPQNVSTTYAAENDANVKTIAGLGTNVIANPVVPTSVDNLWIGSYVYFGKYNSSPVKYRVLDNETNVFGGTTMLLDCDTILWAGDNPSSVFHPSYAEWGDSNLKRYLNSEKANDDSYDYSETGFLTTSFSNVEENAIASSTKRYPVNGDGNGDSILYDFAKLNGEKIFLLDHQEVTNKSYGYINDNYDIGGIKGRIKTGTTDQWWWLRSYYSYTSARGTGVVRESGDLSFCEFGSSRPGVSPALNINLSSVLFTSVITGTVGETGAEYKLTITDSNMTIAGNGAVTREGDTVTIPYVIGGTNSTNATQVSVLILDKEYTVGNTNNAEIIFYGALNDEKLFTLPTELSDKVCGRDYYTYIIAEDVNGTYETDYASEPVKISIPWVTKAMNFGTNGMVNPIVPTSTEDAWIGSYVYFGTYEGNPVKYRVLDSETTVYGGTTMLLDCDSILWNGQFGEYRDHLWEHSFLKTELNGTFLDNNFTTLEKNAIAESSVESHNLTTDSNSGVNVSNSSKDLFGEYVSLNNEKVFLLDVEEISNNAYGYSMVDGNSKYRKKQGSGDGSWWLRSPVRQDERAVGYIGSEGEITSYYSSNEYGVSPAMNVNLSSILFTSASGMNKSSYLTTDSTKIGTTTGAEWKLTLSDAGKTVQITDNEKVIKSTNGTITVPYTYTDTATTNAEKVNQISVMITDKAYTENDAEIMYYGALEINSSDNVGTGTFKLPNSLDGQTLGTDYHIYILAEHTTNTNTTDYASAPIEITDIYEDVSNVTVEVDAPIAGSTLDTTATVPSVVSNANITWSSGDVEVTGKASYNTVYTLKVTLTAKEGYSFTNNTQVTVNGNTATVSLNNDGTITVTYTFPAIKDKLISITAPQSITVANGIAYKDMNLPTTVTIVTEGNTVTTANVVWNTTTPASGSYNPSVLTEQTVTLNGTVICPDGVDANNVALTTKINITINASKNALTYIIIEGENSTWTLNSSNNLTIKSDGDFSKFIGVKVDGKLLEANNYIAKEGSTIIILKAEYLNTLSAGKHTLEIVWNDGSASTGLNIKALADGDNIVDSNSGNVINPLWYILLLVSGVGAFWVDLRKFKKEMI